MHKHQFKASRAGKYLVKTRNWSCKQWVKRLLDVALQFGVRGYPYPDGDCKYVIETKSRPLAWGLWVYFLILKPWSGGWTYICRPGRSPDNYYRWIY